MGFAWRRISAILITMRLSSILFVLLLPLQMVSQTYVGNYTGFHQQGKAVTVEAGAAGVRFTFYSKEILRVDFLSNRETVPDSSFVVVRDTLETVPVTILDAASSLRISSRSIRIMCQKSPLRITYADSTGRVFLAEPPAGGLGENRQERIVRFSLSPDEHLYGTGERGTPLDRRGQEFESYNAQVGGYATAPATMNINVPFLASTGGYALYVDNTYKGKFDIGVSDSTVFSYAASGGELTYYVIAAPTIPAQLERYTWLTGRQPLPPRWAFGYIQSKNSYLNEKEARSIVRTMREKRFPCDALVLDMGWFENMGDIRWDRASWPEPGAMVSQFLAQGIKTVLITEPYIVQSSVNYREAERLGYLAKDSLGGAYVLEKWWSCRGCNAYLIDMTNPEASKWWWNKHPAFLGEHVAGLWTDLGEPERHPAGMRHYLGGTGKVHNVYNLLWAKTVFEGMQSFRPGERVFNLTRSGFAGSQRYGVISWSGDVSRSFGGLAAQLPMLLNMGMSGFAYHNSDIGGYARNPTTAELYVRWMEYGTFSPITRAHGAGEVVHGSATEPWQFGPEAERICRDYINLRYRLLPYVYTMAHENYVSGMPLARPLFFTSPGESRLANESSSYLWGDAFLVSPVVTAGDTLKAVCFPEGQWVNFWTDEIVQGGRTVTVSAPLDRLPLFVRPGSIIPMGPVVNYSDERQIDTLTLAVYPMSRGQSSFTVYEDDGRTTDYQKGRLALTTITQSLLEAGNAAQLILTIGQSRGSFTGKLKRRTYLAEVHGIARRPARVSVNGKTLSEGSAYETLRKTGSEFYFDGARSRLFVQITGSTEGSYAIIIDDARLTR